MLFMLILSGFQTMSNLELSKFPQIEAAVAFGLGSYVAEANYANCRFNTNHTLLDVSIGRTSSLQGLAAILGISTTSPNMRKQNM